MILSSGRPVRCARKLSLQSTRGYVRHLASSQPTDVVATQDQETAKNCGLGVVHTCLFDPRGHHLCLRHADRPCTSSTSSHRQGNSPFQVFDGPFDEYKFVTMAFSHLKRSNSVLYQSIPYTTLEEAKRNTFKHIFFNSPSS